MNAPSRSFIAKEWRRLPATVNRNYAVSEFGDVCSFFSNKDLRATPQKRGGYLAVGLWSGNKGKLWPIHQLVAIGFHGPRPSPRHHAAHLDGNKLNNTPSNVQWCTKEENEAHKRLHGTANIGERNGASKLTADQVRAIRRAHAEGTTTKELRDQYALGQSHLWRILNGQLWSHV